MIWDKSFQSVFESDKEEHWFPLQLMRAVQPFSTHSDDVQVEILKVLLNMTCTHGQSLTSTSITMLISICLEAYGNGNTAVRTAAQATVNQTLTSFCVMLQETDAEAEDQIDDSDAENDFNPLESLVEELYPVLHFTCEKLKDNRNMTRTMGTRKPVAALLLQCVLSVLKNIKVDIHESSEFINFLWQELCPLLVALLGSPKTDKNIVSSQKSCEGTEIGRGSGCLAAAPSCQSMEAKTIYSIAIELVRLTGSIGSLRPVLESLFHRMLLYLPIQHRLEALKAVKELFSKPELLLELAAPPLHATSDKDWISLDLDLIKICIDSLGECCHSSDNNVCYASVSCVSSLLKSLEQINNGEKIKEDFVVSINSQFRTLESADYKGAKSERWLKTKLRNLLADKEKKVLCKSDKADTVDDLQSSNEKDHEDNVIKSSPASSDEGDSSDELDKPMKSDESFENDKKESNDTQEENQTVESKELLDDEEPNSELSEDDVQEKIDLQLDVQNDENLPNFCNAQEIVSPVTESAEDALAYVSSSSSEATIDDIDEDVDVDPEEELDRLRKIPKTLLGEEDAGLWQSQQTMKEATDSDVMSHITILNADGIYLALYSALLLNLKLIRKNYYRDPSCDIPLTEEQFIEEVHGSGVLVYLSAVWLAELYQQVLATNLLEEAGYKPVSLENYALVNLLSGLLFGTDAWWIHNISDVDGLGNSFPGAQQLADYRRLERAIVNTQSTPNVDAENFLKMEDILGKIMKDASSTKHAAVKQSCLESQDTVDDLQSSNEKDHEDNVIKSSPASSDEGDSSDELDKPMKSDESFENDKKESNDTQEENQTVESKELLDDEEPNSELSEDDVQEKIDLQLDVQNDENLPNFCNAQEIVSPVTESAEDALAYVSSSSSEATIDDIDEDVDVDPEEELDRLRKIPKTLLGEEDAGKEERERIENLCRARLEFAIQERQNARRFVKVFQSFLPELLSIRSSIETDQALQEFSSKYCEGLWQSQQTMKEATDSDVMSHITILNADGIYLALYSALLLNLKLIRKNYYRDPSCDIPLTEEQFIEEVHGSGVLVYLSAVWLAELYQQVLATNLLEEAGYKPVSLENYALVNLLSDVDGLGNSFPGAQQLADYRRLERAIVNTQSTPNVDAGRKFSRRILTCCWDTMLEVLSVLLNGTNSCGISSTIGFLLGTEGAKEEHRRTKDAIAENLDGLQRAAKLCNILGLQSNCSAVFAQLAIASCPLSEDTIFPKLSKLEYHQHFKKSLIPGRSKTLRLHASQILSMDVILSRGLELGSHSPDCWKYVFQCCLFVIQLENTYFSGHGNIQSVVSRPVLQTMNHSDGFESSSSSNNYLDLSSMPGSSVPPKLDVNDIINPNRGFAHTSDVIKDHQLLEAIEALSQQVDRLFEEAASRLNLSALISFLVELCAASQVQLFTQNYSRFASSSGHGSNLLLYHLGDVMLRCARGGRPLIHVMKAWSVVAPHFVEAACHKDSMISKKGVTTIHDIVSALLSSNSELPHFHFNEALFKPFENLLCLELCDTDIQEQIVSSICEFVEGCCTEIRSGWRPLFGALRAVRIPSISADINESGIEKEHIHHLRVVLDVFEAFLRTDNVFVFAYAAVDCLLCLLKHVKGPAELQDTSEVDCNTHNVPLDMCLAALKYLEKCSAILSSMYTIPTCPVFNSANRIQLHSEPNLVDPTIPEMEIIYFKDPEDMSDASGNFNEDPMELKESESSVSLQSLEKHTGIIHVWFLLLEGLAGSLATCPKQYQSHTMESLFNMFRNLKEVPGPEFGIYCVNHLLLPMLQNWLRRTTKIYRGWENFATNFKQCCGLATDLIVDYIQNLSELSTNLLSKRSGAFMMIQQLFLVLTECIAQPMEVISRLGCACIRHMIMSAGKYFTPEIWNIICINLKRCCSVSLHDIKQLMASFHSDSDNFYGDIGEVKVAARRDTTVQESERLRQISHQVFLLDCQQSSIQSSGSVCKEDDERTYTFLLFPPNHQQDDPDSSVIRVPFCSLVVGLLSHQILLQTLGSMLLQGTKYMLPTLMTLLPSEKSLDLPNEVKKPGFLSKFSSDQLEILFKCLEDSYETACAFDTRPGLKFLVQKVAQTNVAANLYKQAGVSWSIHMVVLFELCISSACINLDYVKNCISSNSTKEYQGEISCLATPEISNQNFDNNSKESESCPEKILNVFLLLRDKFKEVCETYTEYTIDKDGLSSIVDRMSDQPIFFLAAPADELSDFIFPTKPNDSQTTVNKDKSEPCYDSSDSEDTYMGNEEECKDKIYTIANKQTVDGLINEYKKRKNQHSMPSRLKERLSKRNSDGSKKRTSSNNSVPEEIVNQRRNSIMKDGEAHLQVFKQLIQSFLDLHQSLTDEQFQAFLPVFFPGVQFLVAYTSDGELRLSISEWLQRLAVCCNFYVSSSPSH
ncbi:brefeldin A-inhibited guanine nucleotide-exchange protein 3-like [Uloborus diversus]|uniref:brefeldin A-inhibited guanine nucleotide-exchange protein 3-like n=1 Tax=Uloborus diversus TaxID=327109 RepID=UPI00240A6EA6|nr:brefeldin A-inhibited guanine nucleotide-exchange protein 3-like [Uloborus diversus]